MAKKKVKKLGARPNPPEQKQENPGGEPAYLVWVCAEKHVFLMTHCEALHQHKWCPKCTGDLVGRRWMTGVSWNRQHGRPDNAEIY